VFFFTALRALPIVFSALPLHLLAGPAGLGPRPARVRTGVALGIALDFLGLALEALHSVSHEALLW